MGVENEMYFDKTVDIGRFRFGVQHDLVHVKGDPYLERWILWFGFQIRLHKFYRSDDDRALHDHPWPFITFPLLPYSEEYWDGLNVRRRFVQSYRFHYRASTHRHIVRKFTHRPVWTIVMMGLKNNAWGFWPDSETFVPWREWEEYRANN